MKTIKQTYHIKASIEEVWKGLTDPTYIDGWGGGPVKMNDKVGTKFEFWGGDIYGINTDVVKDEKLVQDWYGGKWAKPSVVTFTLKKVSDSETQVDLLHENLPNEEAGNFADGWKQYFLGPMKEYLENH